jgi:hypothetical protein
MHVKLEIIQGLPVGVKLCHSLKDATEDVPRNLISYRETQSGRHVLMPVLVKYRYAFHITLICRGANVPTALPHYWRNVAQDFISHCEMFEEPSSSQSVLFLRRLDAYFEG